MTLTFGDHEGSIRQEIDPAGNKSFIEYDSFGNIAAGSPASPGTIFGYTGQQWDIETGLYYYKARYYDPQQGRFISEDPSGFAAGDVNLYRYGGNNPVSYTDPTGLCSLTPPPNITLPNSLFDYKSNGPLVNTADINSWPDVNNMFTMNASEAQEANKKLMHTRDCAIYLGHEYNMYENELRYNENVIRRVDDGDSLISSLISNLIFSSPISPISDNDYLYYAEAKTNAKNIRTQMQAIEKTFANTQMGNLVLEASGFDSGPWHVSGTGLETARNIARLQSHPRGEQGIQPTYDEVAIFAPIMGYLVYAPEAVSAALASRAVTVNPYPYGGAQAALRGVSWVEEPLTVTAGSDAAAYSAGATGARCNLISRLPEVPQLGVARGDGALRIVRFDGLEDGILIDRKLSVTTFPKTYEQAVRQSEVLSYHGLTGRWEVPTAAEAARAQKVFDVLGITNIKIKVVPK